MAIALRGEDQLGGLWTGDPSGAHLAVASKMVMEYSGMPVQPHKAIVGANAFAHASGIHQDGMLKNPGTYEIMSPETIGLQRSGGDVGVVMGKLSGRNALGARLKELGYELEDAALTDVFKRFKDLADKKKVVADEDLVALVNDEQSQATGDVGLEGHPGGVRHRAADGHGEVGGHDQTSRRRQRIRRCGGGRGDEHWDGPSGCCVQSDR